MKLLSKINRQFIRVSFPVLILIAVPVYFLVAAMRENEITEGLRTTENWVSNAIHSGKAVSDLYPIISVKPAYAFKEPFLKDTLILDPNEKDFELFTELITIEQIHGVLYEITVRSNGLEKSNLAFLIILVFLLAMFLLYTTLIILNQHISKSMWQPLGETIEIIRNFSLKRHSPVTLNPTDIDEFQHLNLEITKLTDRISFDYQNIKQFSENAAHELLTPLSIIRNKVDTLLSLPGMTEEQLTITASIEDGIDRLNRINRGLLQLSRIENGQFEQFRKINLTKVINDVASELAELLDLKSISYHTYSESEPEIYLDPDLAKILFNNLLNNAIKYTPAGGNVTVTVSKNEIRVTNSGSSPLAGGDKVFTRFYRENMESQSTGLGLAIVRSICTTGSIEIRYEFRDQEHHFILIPPAT